MIQPGAEAEDGTAVPLRIEGSAKPSLDGLIVDQVVPVVASTQIERQRSFTNQSSWMNRWVFVTETSMSVGSW